MFAQLRKRFKARKRELWRTRRFLENMVSAIALRRAYFAVRDEFIEEKLKELKSLPKKGTEIENE